MWPDREQLSDQPAWIPVRVLESEVGTERDPSPWTPQRRLPGNGGGQAALDLMGQAESPEDGDRDKGPARLQARAFEKERQA